MVHVARRGVVDAIPARSRTGGGNTSEFLNEIVKLEAPAAGQNSEVAFQYVEAESDGLNFTDWVKACQASISNARNRDRISFEVQTIADPADQTLSVFRLNDELAQKNLARRAKRKATMAAKQAKVPGNR